MHPIDLAAFWPGYDVVACSHSAENTLTLTLEPRAADLPRCGRCQQPSPLIHDRRIRLVRDRDLLDQRVQLRLPVRRVDCLTCGRVTEHISWLAPASRLTRRLCTWIESLLQLLPISHVSQLTGLHWHTIKTLDKRRLQAAFGTFEPGDVRRLVMDEFALHKGHRYATVIMDAERTRVLWVGLGNSRKAIRPFFEQLGERCQQIEAVAMDMNTAFDLEVKQHCPQAEVVYDLFHVVARYGRDVIDRIRVDQANALRHDKPARQVVKQSRWLLLRNQENLKEDHAVRLQELLAANQPLATVYVLKDALVRAQRTGGLAALASLAEACTGERLGAATALCPQPPALCPGHPRQRTIPHAHQPAGGGEQPDQGDQAHGLWLQGLRLLFPENQGRLPRENAMNQKKGRQMAALFHWSSPYNRSIRFAPANTGSYREPHQQCKES